ncbi:MAG: AAA family ATPase, partial [bacterium]|nr:AAA family ATPase [bacterium]
AQLGLPAVIVSANRLGCINHTLLTVEALRSRNIPVLGIVFMRVSPETDEIIARDNVETVRALSGVIVLGELGRLESPDTYSAGFDRLGEAFLERWSVFNG